MAAVLVVDDDVVFRKALERSLERGGFAVAAAGDADLGLSMLAAQRFDLVLTDLRMPGVDGIEFIRRIKKLDPEAICIVITGFGSAERSIEALEAGAFWFIDKNYERVESFASLLSKALEFRRLRSSNKELQRQLEARYGFGNIVGESEALRSVLADVRKVADTDATVLILGESGTGKELVAHALHYNSRRADQPFVAVNCAAIPEELLESELFGHLRGAFTGAVREREGRFQAANGGTIFLDEIGDMSLNLQAKILRVLQEREFQPVGSSRTERSDVRIIAASNQDLVALIRERRFREDLYFRLNVIPLVVPPLRERREDVPLLARHFARQLAQDHPGFQGITEAAEKRLAEYDWPGNVRELKGLIERLLIMGPGGWIDEEAIPEPIVKRAPLPRVALPPEGLDFSEHVERFTTDLIVQALELTDWNKSQAARLLGLNRTTLVEKIRSKGLTRADEAE